MQLGVDISNYSAIPTPDQTQCWWARGVRFVVIGLQNANIARSQQAACRRFERQYYVDVPGRDLTIPEMGSVTWIDVEPGCFVLKSDIETEEQRIRNHLLIPGIYGNETSIKPVLGNDTSFARLPLLYANYTRNVQVPDFNTFQPFNGWLRPKLWQYAGSTDLCGVNVDLDCREELENDMMTPHNAIGQWWEGRDLDAGSGFEMALRADVNAPPQAKMVRLDVYKDRGTIVFHHGDSGLVAGVLEETETHGEIDVIMNMAGNCSFDVATPTHIRRLGALGFW